MLLNILLVILVIDCVALTGVILLQRSEGGALGMGGGPSGIFTARGAGDLLSRTTAILATVFFVLSLGITLLAGHGRGASSVTERMRVNPIDLDALAKQPGASEAPAASSAPTAPPLPGSAPPLPQSAPPLPTQAPRPTLRAAAPPPASAPRQPLGQFTPSLPTLGAPPARRTVVPRPDLNAPDASAPAAPAAPSGGQPSTTP